jgi:2-haloacid dehalogenase
LLRHNSPPSPGLNDADSHYLTMGWHRLYPWADSVGGLPRLKTKYIISPLSNGNVALLTEMAKFAGLPWNLIPSAELFEHPGGLFTDPACCFAHPGCA